MRKLAAARMVSEAPSHTLQPTALVHEAYLSLVRVTHAGFRDRSHFLSMASRAMRRLLVDHARRRSTQKRGAGDSPVELADDLPIVTIPDERILELDTAITRLESLEPAFDRAGRFRLRRHHDQLRRPHPDQPIGSLPERLP